MENVREARSRIKMKAAEHAVELVKSGMTVGFGSGSTVSMWVRLLGERVRDHSLQIVAVASSREIERLGRSYGIPFMDIDKCDRIDVTVDGADEIAPGLALIKGKGGELLREKMLASSSKIFVVIADSSKVVSKLGGVPIPVEVIPMAVSLVSCALEELGFAVKPRECPDGSSYLTDQRNYVLDCTGVAIDDPYQMMTEINAIVGVVEHGIFLDMVNFAIIADEDGVVERRV
ncbi:ribose-5-phosphate isomerase RpiA [Granulicella mallensis]|uniref:Ribose-5-phosphate isomerase A n=1 Tax=Granulicella mallensis TaxID=940614 RepID=A0A7W7ZN56_9BACT|nr:ribose-5-phosphate isomerase RpiA [Granulicella mallensis]MBB5063039.1 ribose 5-phosphate isomerase A [Granulicella mallensis]